jgi:hypothetical protein
MQAKYKDLDLFPPDLRFKRIKGFGEPIEKVIPIIAAIISNSQSADPLDKLMGPQNHKYIELSEDSIKQYIDLLISKANYSSNPFILSDGNKNGVYLAISLGYYDGLEKLTIGLRHNFFESVNIHIDIIDLFSQVGSTFNGFTGYYYDCAIAAFNESLIPAYKFNSSEVPQGISWINYWNGEQVDNIGRDKVMTAGWFNAIELPNKSVITVATSTRPDFANNSKHLEFFDSISKKINLKALQEKSKPSKLFQFDVW